LPDIKIPISTGEASVYFDVQGVGPGLVPVHGTAASGEQWTPIVPDLARRYTVVTPTTPARAAPPTIAVEALGPHIARRPPRTATRS
jgi:hypothetical protein